jgi:hypothetical protein
MMELLTVHGLDKRVVIESTEEVPWLEELSLGVKQTVARL